MPVDFIYLVLDELLSDRRPDTHQPEARAGVIFELQKVLHARCVILGGLDGTCCQNIDIDTRGSQGVI